MNKRFISLIPLLLSLLLFVAIGGAATAGKPAGSSLPKGVVSWHEGPQTRHAVMALDEVAIFPQSGRAPIIQAGSPPSRDAGRIALSPGPDTSSSSTKEYHPERLSTLRDGPSVGEARPVFYLSPDKTPSSMRIPTGRLIVGFSDDVTPDEITAIEEEYGITQAGAYLFNPGIRIYRAPDAFGVVAIANRLALDGSVRYAYPGFYRTRSLKAYPDDPFFPDQWHLENRGTEGGVAGNDINVLSVWDDYRGTPDEVIAIVDDGLESTHEDLYANVLPDKSFDFITGENVSTAGDHGTSCAGAAAGRGFNSRGITGAAPGAGLVGLRIMNDDGILNDEDEAAALSHEKHLIDIYSNSWGPMDPLSLPEAMLPATEDAIIAGVTRGRNGRGNIYVWAGGNGKHVLHNGTIYEDDNSNYDGYANSRYTIAVAASTDDGTQASYSEDGATILVNAPSSGGSSDITTTDRSGSLGFNRTPFLDPLDCNDRNYTGTFGGTSAAAPLVAGVIALMLEANPALTWRDVQHILMTTAEKNDPLDDDWTTNGAGYSVNHKYGFGRVDARAAVDAALSWTSADDEIVVKESSLPDLPIPDNSDGGVEDRITIRNDLVVEFVEVLFSAGDHPYWADLEIVLTSPSGTESILAERHVVPPFFGYGYENWKFGSLRHFGESSRGDWTLAVKDRAADDEGTFQSWTLRIYGTSGSHGGNGGCFIETAGPD